MFYPELVGTAQAAYKKLVDELKAKASAELGVPESELIVRNMRPEDLEIANSEWYFTAVSAAAWSSLVSSTIIDDNRFVGIYGIHNNEAIDEACQLRIQRMGSYVRYWNVQPIKSFENKVGFVDDPFIVDQNTSITIDLWARTASTLTDFSFIGVTVEKEGMVINP